MSAEALRLAATALKQIEATQRVSIEIVEITEGLAEFTIDKLNSSIMQVTAGNAMDALKILVDLRLRFDELLKQTRQSREKLMKLQEGKYFRTPLP